MESSALAGLSRLMGHKATTVCMVIANRLIKEANTGYKKHLDYNSYELESSNKGLKFKILDKKTNEEKELKTKLIGRHNVVNLTGAIAVADYLKVPMKKIAVKVRELQNVKHRLELLPKGNIAIIDDSYNANPISSKSAVFFIWRI